VRFSDFMEQQRIEARTAASERGKQLHRQSVWDKPEEVEPTEADPFPNLPPETREALAARGIVPEASLLAFRLEIKLGRFDRLARELSRGSAS
jgi:hypothetical protein